MIEHYLRTSVGGSYVKACAPLRLISKNGFNATSSKRGVTCKRCRKTVAFKKPATGEKS